MNWQPMRFLKCWYPSGLAGLIGIVTGPVLGRWDVAIWVFAAAVLLAVLRIIRGAAQPAAPSEPRRRGTAWRAEQREKRPPDAPAVHTKKAAEPTDPHQLAEQMLEKGRCALLLRPQIAKNLDPAQLRRAVEAFDRDMSVVPAGEVLLEPWNKEAPSDDGSQHLDRLVHVDALYLDRYPVTNRQYQIFVDDGGYQQMGLWDPKIWPAVLDFVDQTGFNGPRFWVNGRYPEGKEDHPVVGVSWYEATAYARWVGKRLPSDPEWVKAAAWPVLAHGTRPIQRRYPWGNSMDRSRAHIWGSGPTDTISVYELAEGVSVGGAYHLTGNVWEWTTSDFGVWDASARQLQTATVMKSIRGGAFDTYFETQATTQFQSGECPTLRKRNIGFRCALSTNDVIPIDLDSPDESAIAGPCETGMEEAMA